MKVKLYVFFCLIIPLCSYGQLGNSTRKTYNFNPDWKLFIGDSTDLEKPTINDQHWKAINLPCAWNEDEAFKKPIDSLSTGIVWYRKHFKLDIRAHQKVFLEFEGIRQAGEFYLNGKFIGRHENGITAFGFDISKEIINNAENILAVRIDNAWNYKEKATQSGFQWNDKNFNANYGGITKNVRLHITGNIYQTLPLYQNLNTLGTYCFAKNFNIKAKTATVAVQSELKNESNATAEITLEVVLKDAENKIVATFKSPKKLVPAQEKTVLTAEEAIKNINFWSWGYGYLYTVTCKLLVNNNAVDEQSFKTGFRKTAFKNGMVYLNDRVLMMKGYAQRSSNEWPAIGLSVPPWLSDYSNRLMVESNANLVRWMHITPWKQDIESCDRVGLIQAMPAGDSEKDVTGTRWEQRKTVMRDAIIYNRNNPSILFYECGNESISALHMAEMKAIRQQFDPFGGRAIGSREMLDIPEAEYGGEMLYINKSAGKPLWAMEYCRDEALRKYWDEFSPPYHQDGAGPLYKGADASAYNRNQDSQAIEDIIRWNEYYEARPGTGTRVSAGGVNIIFSDSNTHFRGAENYRRSGEVDAMRIPKDAYFAHQVMWDGWVEANPKGIHLIGHWNYKNGTKKNVYVVAAGSRVALELNGKKLGFGEQSHHFLYTFKNVTFQPGVLKAISYASSGEKLAETQLFTVGTPAKLKLSAISNPTGFKADGADLALIQVEVVDKNGNRCPTALNTISFTLDGPCEWRGGIAQGPGNYILSKKIPVEGGINRVFVRAGKTAGKITIKATSDGLMSDSLSLSTIAIEAINGLTESLPADGLTGNLAKGPTPTNPSYVVHRKAIKILSAEAGANSDKAQLSFDDNELSDWVNDGNISTAWIKYHLAEETTIDAVCLKLNGFRTKTYPLQIFVDGKEVFTERTKPNLGYFTANFKPQKGKTVTIKLADFGNEKEKTEIGTEVNGKKLNDGIERAETKQKGGLSIIEVEVYQKP